MRIVSPRLTLGAALVLAAMSWCASRADDSAWSPSLVLSFDEVPTSQLGELPQWTPLVQSDQATGSSSGSGSDRIDKEGWLGLKAGIFWGTDDISDLDEVFSAEVVFGRYLIGRILSLEADVGFLYDNETSGGLEATLYGIPFFINARVGIPVLFLEPYAGIGVGGLYLHGEIDDGTNEETDDDIVFAGDIFAGLNFLLGRTLFVGAEFKYILTDKTDAGVDFTGYSIFASLGFRI